MKEIWKKINGFNYYISSFGKVKNSKDKILAGYYTKSGYYRINLTNNGVIKRYCIHKLVAEYFIPNPKNKKEVNHKDRNKHNNCIDNLEWCNRYENMQHLFHGISKEHDPETCKTCKSFYIHINNL